MIFGPEGPVTELPPNFSFANLYAARIVFVVKSLPEHCPVGWAEALSRVEQRCGLLLEDAKWAATVDAELRRIEGLERPAHLRVELAFEAIRDLLEHEADPEHDLVNLLFGR